MPETSKKGGFVFLTYECPKILFRAFICPGIIASHSKFEIWRRRANQLIMRWKRCFLLLLSCTIWTINVYDDLILGFDVTNNQLAPQPLNGRHSWKIFKCSTNIVLWLNNARTHECPTVKIEFCFLNPWKPETDQISGFQAAGIQRCFTLTKVIKLHRHYGCLWSSSNWTTRYIR